MNAKTIDPTRGPLFKNTIVYTLPVIATSVLQLLFNAADLVVVGRFGANGSTSVAAVGATTSLLHLFINLFIGLSVGVGVAVSHAMGAKKEEEISRTVHTALPAAFICGIIMTFIGLFFSEPMLGVMGTPTDILPLAARYMKIYFCGMIPFMIYNFGTAILRAAGDTRSPLYFLSIAGVINVLLNLFFVIVCKMTVEGVALATAISQFLSAVLVVRALMKRDDGCRVELKKLRIYKKPLLKIITIGLPAGIQSSLFSISNVIIQSSINSFGNAAMAGSAAAGSIEGFVFVAMDAFTQTALNFTGRCVGAKEYKRIGKIVTTCLILVCSVGVVMGVVCRGFAQPLLSIYISDSAKAIEYGTIRMTYVCLAYGICGVMNVMTGAIRGMGSSVVPMIITVVGVCGLRMLWIFTVFAIPSFHTFGCLFFSYPLSWAITGVAQTVSYFVVRRRLESKGVEV